MEIKKSTGVVVPLGGLRTETSGFIGEYTSLPEFAEFCKMAGLSIIQLLPVLDTGTHSSPYSSLSAFALHPIFINMEDIPGFERCMSHNPSCRAEYDKLKELSAAPRFDYEKIRTLKESILRSIYFSMMNTDESSIREYGPGYSLFVEQNAEWLKPYCVFKNLKDKYNQASWKEWSREDVGLSGEEILGRWYDERLKDKHRFYAWEQYCAHIQLSGAAEKVRAMGVKLKCDLPILLNDDSCDVWATPSLFSQKCRAGSPPDGDNPKGQNWGFPVYDWAAQEKDGFSWWKMRLSQAARYFDAYRLDHIPGFFRFWGVPEGDRTAEFGIHLPYSSISAATLEKYGFSKERIRWLKEPHIPTEDFFRRTGDFDKAHAILSVFCERIGYEELWLFKCDFKSELDIRAVSLSGFGLDEQIQRELTELLCAWWHNRTLIEVKKGMFVPSAKFGETRAWNSLDQGEKDALLSLFRENAEKEELKWGKQAETIFSALIPSTKMVPCGEDFGVVIKEMPRVMEKFGILGLKVIRWCRKWSEPGQPYEKFADYRKLSLVTTSVHDSSTLRQWWETEKDSVGAFCRSFLGGDEDCWKSFDSVIAEKVLSACASTRGVWLVNPLQDWLYLDDSLYLPDSSAERVNIPGTVSEFNWTWRMPVTVSALRSNESLVGKIRSIAESHDK